ncbi:MAG: TRAP transporter substrate-binding protein DctP [Dehalococcoidales bacterium]
MKRKVTPKLVAITILIATIAIIMPLGIGCLPKAAAPAAAPPAAAPPEAAPPEAAPPEAPAEEVQTWHLRGISPQVRSIVERDSIAQCCDIITEMSGGRVTFDWYAGGELMPSEEEIPALKAGTIDMLQWYPLMGTVTELRTIECGAPFATKNAIEFRSLIYHRGLKELFAESYEEQGLIYLGPSLHDPIEICSRLPAYSLEDMEGQRIQLLAEHAYPYEQIGVACMPTPPADVYLAIQTGAMEGFGWSGADEIVMFGMHEVAEYLWDPPLVDVCNVAYLINPDVWASMPSDIQAIIREGVLHLDLWNETIRASGEWKYRTDGSFKEVCYLPEEDIEVLRQHGMDYLDIVAERNARCARAVDIIKAFRVEVDEANWYGH